MTDEKYTFEQARGRLEEIVSQVRKKDVSLEKSIDLLEEGVRLANQCTELSDHTEWRSVVEETENLAEGEVVSDSDGTEGIENPDTDDPTTLVDDVSDDADEQPSLTEVSAEGGQGPAEQE